ncbi:MAG: 50S ribosomal protein L22 [Candidatus Levybacteria bacterium]|nr:50S ribosomal protein L22 [Candidatus Levybacteria bacterium]
MNIVASTKSAKISPRKVRLVADVIRMQSPLQAVNTLLNVRQRGAQVLLKTIKAALANAQNNNKADAANLQFKEIQITEGTALKRFHPSSRGRTHPYKKKSSHVKITLEEKGIAK